MISFFFECLLIIVRAEDKYANRRCQDFDAGLNASVTMNFVMIICSFHFRTESLKEVDMLNYWW